jgi:hypothetical protein
MELMAEKVMPAVNATRSENHSPRSEIADPSKQKQSQERFHVATLARHQAISAFAAFSRNPMRYKAGVVVLPTIFRVNAFARGFAGDARPRRPRRRGVGPLRRAPLTTDYESRRSAPRTSPMPGCMARSSPGPTICWANCGSMRSA